MSSDVENKSSKNMSINRPTAQLRDDVRIASYKIGTKDIPPVGRRMFLFQENCKSFVFLIFVNFSAFRFFLIFTNILILFFVIIEETAN